jgi:SpoVK/Ycf46/Vps4 family AAA+-type ATPase
VKNIIEESVVLPVRHPDIYEGIVRGTRERYESCLPRAILFTGPPGCGKTTVAKILSSEIGIPFVNLRLESLLSKYYGEVSASENHNRSHPMSFVLPDFEIALTRKGMLRQCLMQ